MGPESGGHHGAPFAYDKGLLDSIGFDRSVLADKGVNVHLSQMAVYQNIADGGLDDKDDDEFSTSYDLQVYFDSAKMGLWNNGYGIIRTEGKSDDFGVNPKTGAIIPVNFDAAVPAPHILMAELALGLSKRRVTISTAGVVPAIYALAERTDVALAISLHAPTDDLRNQLVPLNRKYPIAQLLDAARHYVRHLGERRKLVIEYTLIKDVNDRREHAIALANLLKDVRCKINLIPFNPFPGSGYECPPKRDIFEFQTYLMNQGYATMLRTTRGDDIAAACGQLVGQVQDRTKRQARYLARVKACEI